MRGRGHKQTHCGKCGSLIVETNTANRSRYCPICTRARAAQRRRGNPMAGIPQIEVSGARERLRAYIETHPQTALNAILDFVGDRRPDYLGGQAA